MHTVKLKIDKFPSHLEYITQNFRYDDHKMKIKSTTVSFKLSKPIKMTKVWPIIQVYYAKNAGNFLVYYKMRDDNTTEMTVDNSKKIKLPKDELDKVKVIYYE